MPSFKIIKPVELAVSAIKNERISMNSIFIPMLSNKQNRNVGVPVSTTQSTTPTFWR